MRAVRTARECGYTVRAVGARGAKNDCHATDGVSLEFDNYNQVVAFDNDSVTVQAGMKIGTLNEFLCQRGKIIPTCGEWQGATVAGSIATGSHGGSANYGIHSSSVLCVRIIMADGRAMEIGRNDSYFNHAAVSMGLLGVISTITLACVDTFHLRLETRVLPFDRYLQDHAALNNTSEFFASVWFPSAQLVQTFCSNRVQSQLPTAPRMERFSIKTILLDSACRYFGVNGISDRLLARTYVDHGHRILCPIPDSSKRVQWGRAASRNWKAMEAALPLSLANDALIRIDKLLKDNRRAMLNAVGLRTSPADSFTLSPCYERDTIWIDLTYRGGSLAFAEELGATIEEFQGRCHWAKSIGLSSRHLIRRYPRLPEFRRLREKLDPDGTFCNSFTKRMGL